MLTQKNYTLELVRKLAIEYEYESPLILNQVKVTIKRHFNSCKRGVIWLPMNVN